MSLPALDKMWPNLPLGAKSTVATLVGGTIGKSITTNDWDTCCVRVSRALNYSGAAIAGFSGLPNKYMAPGTHVRAQQGADKKWYIFSTYDLRVYLTHKYGHPKVFKGTATASDLAGVSGIIMFGFVHADLWDGTDTRYHDDFGHPKVKAEGILVWHADKTSAPAKAATAP